MQTANDLYLAFQDNACPESWGGLLEQPFVGAIVVLAPIGKKSGQVANVNTGNFGSLFNTLLVNHKGSPEQGVKA